MKQVLDQSVCKQNEKFGLKEVTGDCENKQENQENIKPLIRGKLSLNLSLELIQDDIETRVEVMKSEIEN